MNRCKTCKWWDAEGAQRWASTKMKAGGFCISEKLIEGRNTPGGLGPDTLTYSYDEGGAFWTGPEFGCVHHEEKSV